MIARQQQRFCDIGYAAKPETKWSITGTAINSRRG
jgi:hypothetical protein